MMDGYALEESAIVCEAGCERVDCFGCANVAQGKHGPISFEKRDIGVHERVLEGRDVGRGGWLGALEPREEIGRGRGGVDGCICPSSSSNQVNVCQSAMG